MPPSCWKAPQAAGNGVVVVVLGGDEEMRCRTWMFCLKERDRGKYECKA